MADSCSGCRGRGPAVPGLQSSEDLAVTRRCAFRVTHAGVGRPRSVLDLPGGFCSSPHAPVPRAAWVLLRHWQPAALRVRELRDEDGSCGLSRPFQQRRAISSARGWGPTDQRWYGSLREKAVA